MAVVLVDNQGKPVLLAQPGAELVGGGDAGIAIAGHVAGAIPLEQALGILCQLIQRLWSLGDSHLVEGAFVVVEQDCGGVEGHADHLPLVRLRKTSGADNLGKVVAVSLCKLLHRDQCLVVPDVEHRLGIELDQVGKIL